jgi:hypothetical protein
LTFDTSADVSSLAGKAVTRDPALLGPHPLQELAEFLRRQPRILGNSAHGERLNRIMPWNCDLTSAIAHNNVFALPDDLEPSLFQGADGVQVVNTGNSRHG